MRIGGVVGVGGSDEASRAGKAREHGCKGVVGNCYGALTNDVHGDGRGRGEKFVGCALVELVVGDEAVDEFGGVGDKNGASSGVKVNAVDAAGGGGVLGAVGGSSGAVGNGFGGWFVCAEFTSVLAVAPVRRGFFMVALTCWRGSFCAVALRPS